MEPERDYPAAHSMDTEWYAVDRDGHVGLFQSYEAGAVPVMARSDHVTPREELLNALPEARFRLLDWLGDDREEHHRDLPDRKSGQGMGPTLLFLASIAPVQREVENYQAEKAKATEGVAVLFHDLPTETAWRLHEAGACLGCFPWPEEPNGFSLRDDMARQLGLFCYKHETDNWIAGSYGRQAPPRRPVRIDAFPPDLQEAISQLRFENVRFAEAEKIQPVDHAPCSAWGDAYLDLDGRTIRPIPGREGEFDAGYWSAPDSGFRVEIPPGTSLSPLPEERGESDGA